MRGNPGDNYQERRFTTTLSSAEPVTSTPPIIRPTLLMQATQKAQSSQITLKSAPRRVQFVWTTRKLTLAIASGPVAAMSRRGMPECA